MWWSVARRGECRLSRRAGGLLRRTVRFEHARSRPRRPSCDQETWFPIGAAFKKRRVRVGPYLSAHFETGASRSMPSCGAQSCRTPHLEWTQSDLWGEPSDPNSQVFDST